MCAGKPNGKLTLFVDVGPGLNSSRERPLKNDLLFSANATFQRVTTSHEKQSRLKREEEALREIYETIRNELSDPLYL